jgi:hypothetical protein
MAYTRPAIIEDAVYLSKYIREDDIQEVRAMSGNDILSSLIFGVLFSDEPLAICGDDNKVIGLMGVIDNKDTDIKIGSVWLLASDELLKYKRQLIKESLKYTEFYQSKYDILWNYVDKRNITHIRWLKFCGFSFIKEVNIGIENRKFLEFIRVRSPICVTH